MRIKRDQLRKFLPDEESIKAFEDLFRQFGSASTGIETGKIDFIPSTQSRETGRVWYDSDEGALSVGMNGSEVTLQIGMEEFYPLVANETGFTIENGRILGFAGVNGGLKIQKFIADGSMDPSYIVGFSTETLEHTDEGYACKFGYVRDIDCSGSLYGEAWNKGDILYVSSTIAGGLTKTKPSPPSIAIPCAAVIDNSVVGKLLVRVLPQQRLYYGIFSDSTTQTAGAANTPQAVTINTTDIASGINIASSSRVVCQQAGLYTFQYSLQLTSTIAALQTVEFWIRVNGVDDAFSKRKITIRDNNTIVCPVLQHTFELQDNDYVELIWVTTSTNVTLTAAAATTAPPYDSPSTPSVLVSVYQINQ
jgi:hypothetical protein